MHAAPSAARRAPAVRAWRGLSDAAKRRDPTRSNDIRRRMATGMRQSLALWRSQVYAALVEADALGYDYGEVDRVEIEDLIYRLDILLKRQAEFAFVPGADTMDVMLRTAYARGVRTAGEELTPALPLTSTAGDLIVKARNELEAMLDDQIEQGLQQIEDDDDLAAAVASSRYKLYGLALLPLVIRPLMKRLNALSTTNVTRAYNAGKLDTYEQLGVEAVGVEAETQAGGAHAPVIEQPPELQELQPEAEGAPPERRAEYYTVETVGDDRVCAICESYEGNSYTLAEARDLIPAHPNCRCSIVPLT
jgi:hypothetical protein